MKNKQIMNIHAKRYVDEVFSARLREEGFICPDAKSLCWYRITGEEIVNSIVFFASWSIIPIHLEIGYGIHPLFQKPAHSTSVRYPNRPISHEVFCTQALVENFPISDMRYSVYSGDIQVYAPARNGRGVFTFDCVILPKMESACSIQEVYKMHKAWYLTLHQGQLEKAFYNVSSTFIDEAIYVDDAEMYPYFMPGINRTIDAFHELCQARSNNKEYQVELREWEDRRNALSGMGRLDYLSILEHRKATNLKQCKKWGIIL